MTLQAVLQLTLSYMTYLGVLMPGKDGYNYYQQMYGINCLSKLVYRDKNK